MKRTKILLPAVTGMLFVLLSISNSCNIRSRTISGLSIDSLEVADSMMRAHVDKGELPCVSTLVLKDGEIIHRFTYGMANREEGRALTEDAIFRIYSMSKPVTAAALMILYDEGKFQLDDPVAMYIPEFEDTKVYKDGEEVEQDEPFTIRHLLTHTAGFGYVFDNSYVDSLYAVHGILASGSLEEMIPELAGIPLKHQPGTVYEYSLALDVTGYLVEVLSGLSFDVFLQTRLFDPLKMEDSGFRVGVEDFDRLAMIYSKDAETGDLAPRTGWTNQVKGDVTLFAGGMGLVSTIGDYGRFGQMLLNGGQLDGVRILEESTVNLIMSDQMPDGVSYMDGRGYGLGGEVNLETGTYGWSGIASTNFVVDPQNQMVILSFTQYLPFMGVPFADEYKQLIWSAISE